jgi:hypothetical protein
MTIVFFNQRTQPHYEDWIASGAPTCIIKPSLPQFTNRFTHNNGFLTVETWQTSNVSIQGLHTVQQHLRGIAAIKITKKGELGSNVLKLQDSIKWAARQAHSAWIEAGKPKEFTYIT